MTATATQLSAFYQQACELELQAFKPGNVSVYAAGHGMTVDDFRISAKVSATPLCSPSFGLGEKIYYAVKATREAVGCNTNLGIILLCAPLIQAMQTRCSETPLRHALRHVLTTTTVDDADWVFKAIALAAPGGLGAVDQQDVRAAPQVTLLEAMALAAERDRIALQFVNVYGDIFDFSMPLYYNAQAKWREGKWAAVAVYAELLSRFPDSHIERKYGHRHSGMVARHMAALRAALTEAETTDELLPLLYRLDDLLKSNAINPGTTADLTAATVFAVFLEDVIKSSNQFVHANK